ncbi:MAG: hypothetical protein JW760_07250 [Spirochaetales bacterium]|nr:hypothetical protein [Spirochaetales bacterium]
MKKTALSGILLAALVLMLSGCAELFTFNLFDGLEQVNAARTVADITEKPASEGLEELDDLMDSDNFVDSLAEDPESKEALLDYLDKIASDPEAETGDRQTALILSADIEIKTTGGDDLVNNVAGLLTDPSVLEEGGEPQDLFTALVPEEVESSEEMTAMLLGFMDAAATFEALGNTLDPNDPDSLETDATLGDLAQTALISSIIDAAVTDIAGETATKEEREAAAGELAKLLMGDDTANANFSETFNPLSGIDEGTGVYNILVLSGLEGLFGGGGEE